MGPLLAAAGMLLMLRVGRGSASFGGYVSEVLPAVTVLGAGLVVVVAPLTATVLAAVDTGRAGLASGINNAAARAAGLIAVAALPLLAGMGPEAYRDAGEFAATFRRAMPMCAGLLVLGAVIACWTVRTPPVAAERKRAEERPECTVHCGIVAPPLEPERAREGER